MSFQKKGIQTSKYRHSVGKANKREQWYLDLSIGASPSESSNSIQTSKKWIAYKHGAGSGNSIGILNLHQPGRIGKTGSTFYAHSSSVVDFDFSPFDDDLLASGGEDSIVKIWRIPPDGLNESNPTLNPVNTINEGFSKRIEILQFHPIAKNVLTVATGQSISVLDFEATQTSINLTHGDVVQSFSWKADGISLVSSSKDGFIRVWDPRSSSSKAVQEAKIHGGTKMSRVLYMGEKDQIFSTGFTQSRQKEYALLDSRNLSQPLLRNQLESSSAIIMPHYDPDTCCVYMVGRGETTIKWMEINDSAPWANEGTAVVVGTPISGFTMVPKRCLNIMEGETARLLCISADSIVPISFNVPRKSYRDFHEDLFPHTKGDVSTCSGDEWFKGANKSVAKVSLDPSKGNLITSIGKIANENITQDVAKINLNDVKDNKVEPVPEANSKSTLRESTTSTPSASPSRRESTTAPVLPNLRTSSYRYIIGKVAHPREHFEDIRNLYYGLSGESNVLEANSKFLAFPLTGAGGRIAVARVDKPGRFPPVIPSFIAGSDICDYALSKMNPNLMVTASEDGKMRVWNIDDGGIKSDVTEPSFSLNGHLNRVNLVAFHPFVDNVVISSSIEQIATGGQNPTIRLWDIREQKEKAKFELFQDLILSAAFSTDGKSVLATACKDRYLRVMDARSGNVSISTIGHEGVRGCRTVWANEYLLTTGFNKTSQRELFLFDPRNFNTPLATLPLDISPSILVPHFDEDTNLVYLCGRGDTGILPVEVAPSLSQPLFPVARFDSPNASIQQGVVFMPKNVLDTRSIEVARCWRLTQTSVEPVSFSITRSRKEFFQDDVFPLSKDFERATMSASDWFSGNPETVPKRQIDLCPKGMTKLSNAPPEVKSGPKYSLDKGPRKLTENERQAKFLNEIFEQAQADATAGPLKQDLMEGVASDEWDD